MIESSHRRSHLTEHYCSDTKLCLGHHKKSHENSPQLFTPIAIGSAYNNNYNEIVQIKETSRKYTEKNDSANSSFDTTKSKKNCLLKSELSGSELSGNRPEIKIIDFPTDARSNFESIREINVNQNVSKKSSANSFFPKHSDKSVAFMYNLDSNYEPIYEKSKIDDRQLSIPKIKTKIFKEKCYLTKSTKKSSKKKRKKSEAKNNFTKSTKLIRMKTEQKYDKHATNQRIKSLTNYQEISDFFEYMETCLEIMTELGPKKDLLASKKLKNIDFIPPQANKKIALFDLDETLVHCAEEINPDNPCLYAKSKIHAHISFNLPPDQYVTVGINIRPMWKEMLDKIREKYIIVAYTASHKAYADAVLDYLDPHGEYFPYRLYRDSCVLINFSDNSEFYIKDLDIFKEHYDMKDIVIIDNSILSFAYHLDNGIPVIPFYDDENDRHLRTITYYLMFISAVDDVRVANRKYFHLRDYLAKEKDDDVPFIEYSKCLLDLKETADENKDVDGLRTPNYLTKSRIKKDRKSLKEGKNIKKSKVKKANIVNDIKENWSNLNYIIEKKKLKEDG